jgi:hypothetical protein
VTRTLAGDVSPEIIKTSVKPFHIAKLEFGTATAYVSESQEVVFEGFTYISGGLNVGSMSWDVRGVQKAGLFLVDDNGSAISLALNNSIADTPATLWLVYSLSPTTNSTPTKLVEGYLSPGKISEDGIDLTIEQLNTAQEHFPRQYVTKGTGFDNLPRAGQIVTWGDERFLLENK